MIADRDGRAIVRSLFACALLLVLVGMSGGLLAGSASYAGASPAGASPTATTAAPTIAAGGTATPTPCVNSTQLLFEGFESGTLGLFTSTVIISSTATPVPTPGWAASTATPRSGSYAAFAPGPDRITDQRLELSGAILIPTDVSSATLTFWHNFDLEQLVDGGVLEVSTDSGVTWADADRNIIVGGYNSSFVSFECDPHPPFRPGKRFWSGTSNGYRQVVVNLLPYAGTSFKFRFRLGTDCAVSRNGWSVDDIAVNMIQSCPTQTATATPTRTATYTPTPCPNWQLFYEGFEGTLGQFTSTAIISSTTTPVPTPGWSPSTINPHTGGYAAFAPDPDKTTDSRLTLMHYVRIPTNVSTATLSFWHNFDLEWTFDGGVLEMSTDAGTTWTDARPNIIVGGYNSMSSDLGCLPTPPFGTGRPFWSNVNNTYTQVVVNLLPYAGTDLKFRFRLGTDCGVGDVGWYIDDIEVNAVGTVCSTPTITPTATRPSSTPTATHTVSATPTTCPLTQVFFEGFESGTLGTFTSTVFISSTTTPVPTPGWSASSTNPRTGGYAAFAPDPDRTTDSRLTTINSIHIPSGVNTATLTFWHYFDMENAYDGGVLEVSTDGGATWVDARNNIIVGTYNSSVSFLDPCVPIQPPFVQGRPFWSNVSNGYRHVVVNLLPYAGTDLKFRFRLGTDCNVGDVGWYIDDIAVNIIEGCITPTATQPTSTPTSTRTATSTSTSSSTPLFTPSTTATITAQPSDTPTTGVPIGTATTITPPATHTATQGVPTGTATGVAPTATPCPVEFTDVPPSDTFYPYVRCLACQGIFGGYADGTFRPNADVTRGQLSKIVANSAGFNEPVDGQTFEDVPPGSTFYPFVERLSSRGIIGGYPCGGQGEPCVGNGPPYFRPNANATRGQISKIVSNARGYSDPVSGQIFEDVPPGSAF
ncbi:MAG TPA: S-layer homology domain-containing protein [Chloroflexia bacterium]|nr:S-layer homology domain-containing protein [Chloroflexia bacterium]